MLTPLSRCQSLGKDSQIYFIFYKAQRIEYQEIPGAFAVLSAASSSLLNKLGIAAAVTFINHGHSLRRLAAPNSASNFPAPSMVKVQIVEEAEDKSPYASSASAASSSTDSLSTVNSDIDENETVFERIAALVDIVPPTTRHKISSRLATTGSVLKRGSKLVGNIVWVLTTSALLVALPLALSLEDEAKIVQQEKEMLEQQAGAQQVSPPRPLASIPILNYMLYR